MKKVKASVVCLCLLVVTVLLSGCACNGCSVTIGNTTLQGPNVLFTPFLAIWHWIWYIFTPEFWGILAQVWEMPAAIVWLAGPVAYLLGGALYLVILIVALAIDIVLGLLAGIIWFFVAMFGGVINSCGK